ncbi:hypothetical protein GCK72_017711 [Caenorhabditis remanei]|uniref:Uncharacterized protein n=1 Tax=Caenorhabditis remanei TaxID=31234 RepID=A0A6A5G815_CAERE|nr:hypothetical protein GCK72_017711 [Caenorhabditis remanei]KAF1751157.1 hypothetical protein GCK72_017711 [Caenorhabditis remanei]
MLKFINNLACMNKKPKNKLALTAGPSESASSTIEISPRTTSEDVIDETLNQSVAIPEGPLLNTSHFMSNILSDVSYDAAAFQNRATPIDFCTREVKADDDVLSIPSRRRSVNTLTPSPIPEETEDNLTDKNATYSPDNLTKNTIFEPRNRHCTPRLIKVRKHARVYNGNESIASASSSSASSSNGENHRIDSVRARASKSAISQQLKLRLTPVIGGSLRPIRAKRHSVAFDGNSTFTALDRRRSELDRSHFHERLSCIIVVHRIPDLAVIKQNEQ